MAFVNTMYQSGKSAGNTLGQPPQVHSSLTAYSVGGGSDNILFKSISIST